MSYWITYPISYQNEIVLDVFAGSGTTALACKELNRKYIVSDISKEYYDLIRNRIGDSIWQLLNTHFIYQNHNLLLLR